MKNYIIKDTYLANVVEFQKKELYNDFEIDDLGNLVIPYNPKFYTCNDKENSIKNTGIMALSFFSGCGGLDIGTQLAGVKILSSLDNYEDSVETMKKNKFFEGCLHINEDIKNVTGKDFEELIKRNKPEKLIIVGGPPCQPFSKAGYWVTNEKRNSKEDPRNMIEPYFKIISEIMPDGFVLENVESILHPSNKEAIESIINNINKLGYHYSLLKINAADFGIPQKRKRVFFLASKKKICAELEPTHGDEKARIKNPKLLPYERVIDWIGKYDDEKYYKGEDLSTTGKWEEALTMVPPGKNYIALTEKANHPNPIFVAGKRYWNSLLKLHPYEPSCTIIASPGHWEGPFHWNNRRLSIRECAAIQTFPEDYVFYGNSRSQRKQIGNAVPPLLAKQIIEELCRWL